MASGESRDVRRYKKVLQPATKPLAVTQQEVKSHQWGLSGSGTPWLTSLQVLHDPQMKSGHDGER